MDSLRVSASRLGPARMPHDTWVSTTAMTLEEFREKEAQYEKDLQDRRGSRLLQQVLTEPVLLSSESGRSE